MLILPMAIRGQPVATVRTRKGQAKGKTPCLPTTHKDEHERSQRGSMSSVYMQEGGWFLFSWRGSYSDPFTFVTHSLGRILTREFSFFIFISDGSSYRVFNFRISTA